MKQELKNKEEKLEFKDIEVKELKEINNQLRTQMSSFEKSSKKLDELIEN